MCACSKQAKIAFAKQQKDQRTFFAGYLPEQRDTSALAGYPGERGSSE
jgi:hypothetical protein